MNSFMETQCMQMLSQLDVFNTSIRMAAIKDDGKISPAEEKQLKKLQKASDAFAAEIQKLIKA